MFNSTLVDNCIEITRKNNDFEHIYVECNQVLWKYILSSKISFEF